MGPGGPPHEIGRVSAHHQNSLFVFHVFYSTHAAGLVTAMRQISATVNPASSSFCANMAKPSATGGLMVWPRSVESRHRSGPALRMLAKTPSHDALPVYIVVKQCSMIAPRPASV